MSNQYFADGVSRVYVVNGVVRLELNFSTVDLDGKVQQIPSDTLALPLNGFINLHAQVDQVIKKMVEDGILKSSENQAEIVDVKKTSKNK